MRIIICLICVNLVECFFMNMNFKNYITSLDKNINLHKINENSKLIKLSKGDLITRDVNEIFERSLYLYKEYSLIKFLKYLEKNEESKKIIFKNLDDISKKNRLGFNELDILRRNGFVLVYSRSGEVIGGLISIKTGKGDIIMGYLNNNNDIILNNFLSEPKKENIFSNIILRKIMNQSELEYYTNCYIIEKFIKNTFLDCLKNGIKNYNIDDEKYIKLLSNIENCEFTNSYYKLHEIYEDNSLNTKEICYNTLNEINKYLNK